MEKVRREADKCGHVLGGMRAGFRPASRNLGQSSLLISEVIASPHQHAHGIWFRYAVPQYHLLAVRPIQQPGRMSIARWLLQSMRLEEKEKNA